MFKIQIIRRAVGNVTDPEVAVLLPERNNMRRVINQHQNRGRPRNPQTLQDIVIDAPYNQTLRNSRFLLYDSGSRFLLYLFFVSNTAKVKEFALLKDPRNNQPFLLWGALM